MKLIINQDSLNIIFSIKKIEFITIHFNPLTMDHCKPLNFEISHVQIEMHQNQLLMFKFI